ncbi:MAG: TspO/MBR family protein [Thermodesulfobacteriota bacterium]
MALCQTAGVIGSLFTLPAIPVWYAGLKKPFFSPPNWIFSPVWIGLFTLMGVSLFLVWGKESRTGKGSKAMVFFFVQLGLNALWSVLFFGLRSPLAGLMGILLLWAAIVWTMVFFFRISSWAGYLFIPYLLWVSFALVLNFSLWTLN